MNIPKTVAASKFNISKGTKTMSAEASDLATVGGRLFGQIYPDACDDGIHILNCKTGHTTSWAVSNIAYNSDDDLMYWELAPIDDSIRSFPALKGWRAIIYND